MSLADSLPLFSFPDPAKPTTLREVIVRCGGAPAIARRIGKTPEAVYMWQRRGLIPPEHFPALVALSNRTVSLDQLYALNAMPKGGARG